jgi:hypothetical protein
VFDPNHNASPVNAVPLIALALAAPIVLIEAALQLGARGLIGGPEALIFDAAKIERSSSIDHTIAQVRALADRLDASDEALEAAIVNSNILRAQTASPEAAEQNHG